MSGQAWDRHLELDVKLRGALMWRKETNVTMQLVYSDKHGSRYIQPTLKTMFGTKYAQTDSTHTHIHTAHTHTHTFVSPKSMCPSKTFFIICFPPPSPVP